MFRKLEFDTIYYAYLNKSPFKYYISILRGVGGGQTPRKLAYIILACSLIPLDSVVKKLVISYRIIEQIRFIS